MAHLRNHDSGIILTMGFVTAAFICTGFISCSKSEIEPVNVRLEPVNAFQKAERITDRVVSLENVVKMHERKVLLSKRRTVF